MAEPGKNGFSGGNATRGTNGGNIMLHLRMDDSN
jgi:hypothetical protein